MRVHALATICRGHATSRSPCRPFSDGLSPRSLPWARAVMQGMHAIHVRPPRPPSPASALPIRVLPRTLVRSWPAPSPDPWSPCRLENTRARSGGLAEDCVRGVSRGAMSVVRPCPSTAARNEAPRPRTSMNRPTRDEPAGRDCPAGSRDVGGGCSSGSGRVTRGCASPALQVRPAAAATSQSSALPARCSGTTSTSSTTFVTPDVVRAVTSAARRW